jgi:HK97 family phage prohead protease
MTPAQLAALLAAGLIDSAQYTAALATRTPAGLIETRPVLDVQINAGAVRLAEPLPDAEEGDADESDAAGTRELTGTVCVYEQLVPSHGMILHTGALEPRMPLERVKMLRDHNHSDPVGYMTALDLKSLEATFYIPPGENGDRALLEASPEQKLRDGLSVGFSVIEYEFDEDWTMHVHRAELYEVSLCAIPAIADAGVTSVAAALATHRKDNTTMNRAQLAAALAAGTITQEQHDAALATLDLLAGSPAPTQAAAAAVPAEVAAGPQQQLAAGPVGQPAPTPGMQVADRQLSLREVTRRVAAAANTGDVAAVALALADIIPANDAGEGFVERPEWLDELFTASQTERPYIDAIGTPQPLTALRAKGWRWDETPEVEEYDGNKEEVPTGPASTAADEYRAFRVAAGWDIDRAYVDFGDETFLSKFWEHVGRDYQIKSEAGIRSRVLALKANAAGTVTAGGVKAVLKQAIRDGRAVPDAGVKINRIFLASNLFEELEDLDTEHLPLWLKNATLGMSIADGTANAGDLRIALDSKLAAGEFVAFDNRGLKVREKQIPQIRALDVAHMGIDLGFISYLRLDDEDPRLIFRRKYVPAA